MFNLYKIMLQQELDNLKKLTILKSIHACSRIKPPIDVHQGFIKTRQI